MLKTGRRRRGPYATSPPRSPRDQPTSDLRKNARHITEVSEAEVHPPPPRILTRGQAAAEGVVLFPMGRS